MNKVSKHSLSKLNLAVALADVINSLMMEFQAESRAVGKELTFDTKMRFKMLQSASEALRKNSKSVADLGYNLSTANIFCEDSDWLYEILMLIVEKSGDNNERMDQIKEFLTSIPTEL